MMTPKEVQEHGFPRSRKGYDMAEVDEFLDKLTEDYTALYTNYGKLSSSYAKLRKKAQAMASALEQMKQQPAVQEAPAAPVQAVPVAPAAPSAEAVDAAEDVLRSARKDAQAIRAGAERERQEIIEEATGAAARTAERLKAEVAAEEQHLADLKKATAAYISQVRQLISRQQAVLDDAPLEELVPTSVQEEVVAAAPVAVEAAPAPVADEPTVRVDEAEASVAEEISRNMLNLSYDSAEDADEDTIRTTPADDGIVDSLGDLDDTGSLFDAIVGADNGEFDEE